MRCRYPHSLFFLDMLQSKQFRTSMASMEVEVRLLQCTQLQLTVPDSGLTAAVSSERGFVLQAHVEMQQFHFWQHYRHNRVVQAQAASADKQVTQ